MKIEKIIDDIKQWFKKNKSDLEGKLLTWCEDGYIIKAPKSESGIRDIHMGREVMEELRKAKVQHFSQMMESGVAFNQKYNFVVRQDDGSPFTPDAMTRKWKRFIRFRNMLRLF